MMASIALNFIIAIAATFFTFLCSKAAKIYKAKKEEKELPVSGKYLSVFEDEVDELSVLQKSPVKIEQSGKRISGKSKLNDRIWILEGEVTNDGYIYGRYYAEHLQDKGMGNFFLEVLKNGDMEGLWSGYDSVNKKIVSGKYYFYKDMDIKIRNIKKEDVPAIIKIAEQQLGDAYIDPDSMIDRNNIRKCALYEDRIVGFCIGSITHEKLIEDDRLNKAGTKSFNFIDEYGYLASLAVEESFTGKGIGTSLMESWIKDFKSYEVDYVVMTAWKSSNGVHIGGIADQFGFDVLAEIPNYWKEESIAQGFSCPECGQPPCICTAVIYYKTL